MEFSKSEMRLWLNKFVDLIPKGAEILTTEEFNELTHVITVVVINDVVDEKDRSVVDVKIWEDVFKTMFEATEDAGINEDLPLSKKIVLAVWMFRMVIENPEQLLEMDLEQEVAA